MAEKEKLTPLMKKFEEETGKHAKWGGELTKAYKKWRREHRGEEEVGGPGFMSRLFSRVGGKVIETGEASAKAPSLFKGAVRRGPPTKPEKEEVGLSKRLEELKRLETERERIKEVEPPEWEEEEEEEEVWEAERIELERPLPDRLADSLYKPLKRPATALAESFGGLDEDLMKAGMTTSAERYMALILGVGIIVGAGGFILGNLLLPLPLALVIALVGFMLALFMGRRRPKSRISSRTDEINQTLPYALRHIATQLSSGIGLAETMTSVARADYGVLSEEFGRVLHDMRTGSSTNEALSNMINRVESEALNRSVRQIQRTMRTGGDLADTLSGLADETAFDLRMNLQDYTQSLNMMSMIYMFASAVIPPMFMVLLIVMKFMGGVTIPTPVIALIYLIGLPFMLFFMVRIFQGMEPGV